MSLFLVTLTLSVMLMKANASYQSKISWYLVRWCDKTSKWLFAGIQTCKHCKARFKKIAVFPCRDKPQSKVWIMNKCTGTDLTESRVNPTNQNIILWIIGNIFFASSTSEYPLSKTKTKTSKLCTKEQLEAWAALEQRETGTRRHGHEAWVVPRRSPLPSPGETRLHSSEACSEEAKSCPDSARTSKRLHCVSFRDDALPTNPIYVFL